MPPQLTYFDACVLTYRAQFPINPCPGMPARVGPEVEKLLTDPDRECLVSDLGMLEFQNTLAKLVRNSELNHAGFDLAWMDQAHTEIMMKVVDGKIQVLTTRPQAYQQATSLVTLATREHGMAFGTWDVIHLATAATIGFERGRVVDVVTSDKGLAKFIGQYPHFGRFVNVIQLDDPGDPTA